MTATVDSTLIQAQLDAVLATGLPGLRAWLEGLPGHTVIGRCGRGAECVIARWVEAGLGLPPASGRVYAGGVDVRVFAVPDHPADGHGDRVALARLGPSLRRAVQAFDALGDGRGGRDYIVTAAEILAALSEEVDG